DRLEEAPPALEPLSRDARVELEIANAEPWARGVAVDHERRVLGTEETGAGGVVRRIAHGRVGREVELSRVAVRDEASERGMLEARRGGMRGEEMLACEIVLAEARSQRTNDGDAIRERGGLREELRKVRSRDACGSRAEGAAHLARRIDLGVERVDVARTAVEPNEDAGPRPRRSPVRRRSGGQSAPASEVPETDSERRQRSGTEDFAPQHAIAANVGIAHGSSLSLGLLEKGRLDAHRIVPNSCERRTLQRMSSRIARVSLASAALASAF